MRFSSEQTLGAALVISMALLSLSCANDHPTPTTSLAPMWRQMIATELAKSDLPESQRKILEDYQITDAEYHEAWQAFAQCMIDRGWDVTLSDSGGYTVQSKSVDANDPEAMDRDNAQCQFLAIGDIDGIYLGIQTNPHGLTHAQMIRQCYQNNGVTDGQDLTDDQFADLIFSDDYKPSSNEAILCLEDPDGSQGLTPQQAIAIYNLQHDTTPS
jgi:hypothetical protein